MKKMNIALFTAAAMFATTAVAEVEIDGPTLGGRIQTVISDGDALSDDALIQNTGDGNTAGDQVFLAASGSATGLVGGFDMSYYLRAMGASGDVIQNSFPYSYVDFEHDALTVQAGRNDDLIYRFVESHNFANRGREYTGVESPEFGNSDQISLTSDFAGSPVTLGIYANDEGKSGINTTQFGLSADLGPATIAAVHSISEDDVNSDPAGRRDGATYFGGTYDFGMGNISGRIANLDSGETPYAVALGLPVTQNTTIRLFYGDDNGENNTGSSLETVNAEVRTMLGAGLSVFAGLNEGEDTNGDSADNIYVGSRLSF